MRIHKLMWELLINNIFEHLLCISWWVKSLHAWAYLNTTSNPWVIIMAHLQFILQKTKLKTKEGKWLDWCQRLGNSKAQWDSMFLHSLFHSDPLVAAALRKGQPPPLPIGRQPLSCTAARDLEISNLKYNTWVSYLKSHILNREMKSYWWKGTNLQW
jgi:hypothetical protein